MNKTGLILHTTKPNICGFTSFMNKESELRQRGSIKRKIWKKDYKRNGYYYRNRWAMKELLRNVYILCIWIENQRYFCFKITMTPTQLVCFSFWGISHYQTELYAICIKVPVIVLLKLQFCIWVLHWVQFNCFTAIKQYSRRKLSA